MTYYKKFEIVPRKIDKLQNQVYDFLKKDDSKLKITNTNSTSDQV